MFFVMYETFFNNPISKMIFLFKFIKSFTPFVRIPKIYFSINIRPLFAYVFSVNPSIYYINVSGPTELKNNIDFFNRNIFIVSFYDPKFQ